MNNKVRKTILDNCHGVAINMNDTFYYACSDVAIIDSMDLEDLSPMIEKYGFWAFVAYEAIKRGHDPMVPVKPAFKEAKGDILKTIKNADEYGEFFDLRSSIKLEPHTPETRKKISKVWARAKDWFSFFSER